MSKTYVKMFTDMLDAMCKNESLTSNPDSVNSAYMGHIAMALSAIADELHKLNENLNKDEKITDCVNSEYEQPVFIFDNPDLANIVKDTMAELIKANGFITVARVKVMIDEEAEIAENDRRYGWYDMNPYELVANYNMDGKLKTWLNLPKVERIKEIK